MPVAGFNTVTVWEAFWVDFFVLWCFHSFRLTESEYWQTAVRTGMEVADDVIEVQPLKQAAQRRVSAGIKRSIREMQPKFGSGVRTVKRRKIAHDIFS